MWPSLSKDPKGWIALLLNLLMFLLDLYKMFR